MGLEVGRLPGLPAEDLGDEDEPLELAGLPDDRRSLDPPERGFSMTKSSYKKLRGHRAGVP